MRSSADEGSAVGDRARTDDLPELPTGRSAVMSAPCAGECEKCDPEQYQAKWRRRWWRQEKCRLRSETPPFITIELDGPLGFPQTEAARRRAARAERRYFEEVSR